jgi:hypothetical protein
MQTRIHGRALPGLWRLRDHRTVTRGAWLVVRLVSAFMLLLTATFYLIASIPFAFYMFLESPPWRWIPVFARVHPLLLFASVGGLLAAAGPLDDAVRSWARRLMLVTVTFAACMALSFWLPALQSYELSAAFCFVPLTLLIGASVIELVSRRETPGRALGSGGGARAVAGAALAGFAASMAFAINTAFVERAARTLQPRELVVGAAVALGAHVALFAGVAFLMLLTRLVAVRLAWTPSTERLAIGAVAAGLLAILVRRAILTALAFDELRAIAVAIALAIGLVSFGMTLVASRPIDDGQMPPSSGRRWARAAACAAVIGGLVFVLPPMLRLADWGLTLQKLAVMMTWMAACGLMAAARRGRGVLIACVLMVAWGSTVAAGVWVGGGQRMDSNGQQRDTGLAVERYATFDLSLRVVLDVVRPMQTDYAFLTAVRREGDATSDRHLHAVPLRLVDEPRVDPSYRPHIFIVVVDSLRPDYLSAYNPAVTFTPAIRAFARESIVMRRAFTAYAGTALSEPAIWAGGLVPRAMYVKPFSPMNNLERLLVAGGYRRYITVDQILGLTLEDWSSGGGVIRLDAQLIHPERESDAFKVDLCQTFDELATRLDADRPTQPLFFFTQPQNLHIRVIAGVAPQWGQMRLAPGEFFKPAVTTLTRLDRCFGRFIDDLKARRLYDDSIVVLTSDHGDAYGEEGRWGHAFYLTPETLRIPLIMHVPERLRAERHWNADAVAWLTDVTPTLYELLGDPPTSHQALVGRTLLRRAGEEPPPKQSEPFLVQSSYSPMFGLIDRNAQWLYVADANRFNEKIFDLRDPIPTARPILSEADRRRYQKWLLDRLGQLNAYYVK